MRNNTFYVQIINIIPLSECMKTTLDEFTPTMLTVTTDDSANGFNSEDILLSSGWIADARNPVIILILNDEDDSPKVYQVSMTVTNVKQIEAELKNVDGVSVATVTVSLLVLLKHKYRKINLNIMIRKRSKIDS